MGTEPKQTTTVDGNYEPSKSGESKSMEEVGATKPFSHPCANTTVDGNYSDKGGYGSGGGSKEPAMSNSGGDMAGINGAGGKYTDDSSD